MPTLVPWAAGAAGLLAGPLSIMASERAIGKPLPWARGARGAAMAAASAAVGGLCLVGSLRLGATPLLLAWCWACSLGVSLAITDLRSRRLPFPLVGALAAGGFGAFLAGAIVDGGWRQLAFACSASIAVLLIAGLVQLGVPAHTGGGDTALYGAIAMYLGWFGWEGLLRGLLVASGLTAAVALVVVMRSGHTNVRFPAGPSLLAGAAISILFA